MKTVQDVAREFANKLIKVDLIDVEDAWYITSGDDHAEKATRELELSEFDWDNPICTFIGFDPDDGACNGCIFGGYMGCGDGIGKKTFDDIDYARTPEELHKALNKRGEFILSLIQEDKQ